MCVLRAYSAFGHDVEIFWSDFFLFWFYYLFWHQAPNLLFGYWSDGLRMYLRQPEIQSNPQSTHTQRSRIERIKKYRRLKSISCALNRQPIFECMQN